MRKKICFLLFILITALIPTACAGNPDTIADEIPEISTPTEAPDTTPVLTGEKTPAPTLIDKTFLSKERYCIAGRGEEGAAIRIEGGVKPASGTVIDGQFIVEVFLENQKENDVTLRLYAKSENKEESGPLIITVGKDEKREDKPLYVGKNNHIHYADTIPDFLGNSLFKDSELDLIKNGAENFQKKLTDEGLKAKVIIIIPPNHSTIYPETMSDFLIDQKASDNSRLKQLTETFKNSTIKFINPYDRLMKEKENYFIYNRTDTHWNELGAYFGYCEVFDYIGETFPNAKPIPLSDFNVYKSIVRGGDLIPMFKFDQNEYIENSNIVRIKNPTVNELFRSDTNEIPYQEQWYHQYHEYDNNDSSKPTILMYRDSFSITMLGLMAETSGKIIFGNMWDYEIKVDYIKQINPDFVVIEKVERILGDFPGIFWRFK